MSAVSNLPNPDPSPVRLDQVNRCLWRGKERLALTPKTFAVLHTLMAHTGQLVSKADLLEAVWPETFVSEAVLKFHIRRLRQALGDQARHPRFIETLHGQGYRLIAALPLTTAAAPSPGGLTHAALPQPIDAGLLETPWLVGREGVLAQMQGWLARARHETRQVGFVTGEVGIGKTTVVDAFLDRLAADDGINVLGGQCVEHYGPGEAYLPLLEALWQGCRGPHSERYLTLLRRYAPTWLLHMPGLLDDSAYEALQRQRAGIGRERMLREMAEALEALASDKCLVLVLEDLHWSDVATLDLVTLLAQRRGPAQLLLLGTFRPEDLPASDHPLQAVLSTLRRQSQVDILPLTLLTAADVTGYLAARFPASTLPATLASMLHQHTEGNPLFLVTLMDHLVAQGVLKQVGDIWAMQDDGAVQQEAVPDTLQQVIMQRRTLCSPDAQRVLAVSSVAGISFSAADVLQVYSRARELCEQLEAPTRLFRVLQNLAAHYRVQGALQKASEIEEQLLTLAQEQHDPVYLFLARKALGTNAYYQGAFAAARAHLEQGIALCNAHQPAYQSLRDAVGRDLGVSCIAFAALTLWSLGYPDQARTYMQQAIMLAEELAHPFTLAWTLHNASKLYQSCGEVQRVHELASTVVAIATEHKFAYRVGQGQVMQGWTLFAQGRGVESAQQIEQGLETIRALGGGVMIPYFLALLAAAYGQAGQITPALAVVTEALNKVDVTGARCYEAELYRLKGELLLVQEDTGPQAMEAEECFGQALAIARQQQARTCELPAAMSLSRLWQRQGKRKEARQLLSEVYGWFTEGFDTADLKDAKALLDALGRVL